MAERTLWWILSLGLFVGLWEVGFALGWFSAEVLPPPHQFIPAFPAQAMHFDFGTRIAGEAAGSSAIAAILLTTASTIARVCVGLGLGFALGVATGIGIRYSVYLGRLVLPMVTLLAPISPFAWLPVAVFVFGVGDLPAVFLVFVAVFFIIVLATIAEIERVPANHIDAARIMGATRPQLYLHVILPSILPGLFLMLRMNMFAAWMVVLVAESAGTSHGLGAVIMLARNTANNELVFLGFVVIGVVGFAFDWLLRQMQDRLLYWQSSNPALLTG
ncbi:MAG: ABC transporter permease subunit [Gammaproteobacteria bacterium]|nr:ABC transporter permease subunit [Gammaproteobacteria bacterium]